MDDYVLAISDFKPAFAMGGGATRVKFPRGPSTHTVECWALPGLFIMRYHHLGTVRTELVLLTHTEPYFGGRRWYFVCPRCERRCTKIRRPMDRDRYLCRKCHERGDDYAPVRRRLGVGQNGENGLVSASKMVLSGEIRSSLVPGTAFRGEPEHDFPTVGNVAAAGLNQYLKENIE